MHSSATVTAHLKKLLYGRVGTLLPRLDLGPGTACLGFAPGDHLSSTWREATGGLGDRRIIPVVSAASPGTGRKAILGGYRPDGTPVCFVKFAGKGPRAVDLAREAEVLGMLETANVAGLEVPRVLVRGDFANTGYLTLSPAAPGKPPRPGKPPYSVVDVLAGVFRTTETSEVVCRSACWRRLEHAAEANDPCARALAHVGRRFGARPGRLGLAHRDFVFWNIRLRGGKVVVLDWEWAEESHIPFQDLLHYHLHGPVNAARLDPVGVARRAFYGRKPRAAGAVRRYARAINVPLELSWDYFVLYLVDWLGQQTHLGNAETSQVQGYRALLQAVLDEERMRPAAWLGGGVAA